MLLLLVGEANEELWTNAVTAIEVLVKDRSLLTTLLSILIEYELQNKQGFEIIKQRLTSNIFIRLSGLSEGYKFIELKHPSWLEAEY